MSIPVELTFGNEEFRPRDEPVGSVLVSERYVNERVMTLTRQTDHAMLTPLPAPGTRPSMMTSAFTERPMEIFDPTLTGEKVHPEPGAQFSGQQDQNPYNSYHVNTLRMEPTPWDEELIG